MCPVPDPLKQVPTPVADTALVAWGEAALEESAPIGRTMRVPEGQARESFSQLPRVPMSSSTVGALVIQKRLGEGGMGVIDQALDPSLGRAVAVKRAHLDPAGHCAAALVEEGRTLARLEHPNVVPVYAMGVGEDGAPLLVMKEIHGRTWSDVLDEGRDLERDLGIFVQVAEALRFAHARGVLHRDVKIDNVMIGTFGEVYLMDWGCAVALERAVTTTVVGTPGSMPIEMLRVGDPLGPWTDVFLLGATLHQAICGGFRNRGAQLAQVIASAWMGEPWNYGPEVPDLIASLLNKACARAPGDRFQTVDELLVAVRGYQQHRGALLLGERANAAAGRFRAARALNAPDADEAFADATQNYAAALIAWPGFERARVADEALSEEYLAWKVAVGEFGAAAHHLARCSEALRLRWDPRLAEARQRRDADASRLHGLDLAEAAKEWRRAGIGTLLMAGVSAALVHQGAGAAPFTWREVFITAGLAPLIVAFGIMPVRHRLLRHTASRLVVATLVIQTLFSFLLRTFAYLGGSSVAEALRFDILLGGVLTLLLGVSTDRRFVVATFPYVPVAAATIRWPDLAGQLYPVAVFPSMIFGFYFLAAGSDRRGLAQVTSPQ